MGVLLMAMTIGGLTVAGVLLAISIYAGKSWLRNFVFGGVAVWFVFYFAMLIGSSLKSEERELALNEPKAFCGFYLDCHMHTAVADVRRTKTLGNKTANGEFYVVTVEVSSNAVKATLGLHSPEAEIVDAGGQRYGRDEQAESFLPPQPEFENLIGPEESFTKQIVFDLPSDIRNPRLDIREGIAIERIVEAFIVGDEDSVFHQRSFFKLGDADVGLQVSN